jgi:hypothetical protein
MFTNSIILLPLSEVLRTDIARPLKHILHLHSVGSLVAAWHEGGNRASIEHFFDSPAQARHAVTTCAAWLGIAEPPAVTPVGTWWRVDGVPALPAEG